MPSPTTALATKKTSTLANSLGAPPEIPDPFSLSPEQWLEQTGWPLSTLHLEPLAKGNLFELLLSLIKGPVMVERGRFLFAEPEQVVYGKQTRLAWLMGLSAIIVDQYRVNPRDPAYDERGDFVHRLSEVLTLRYGEPTHEIPTRQGSMTVLNTIHFGALFAYACDLEYDEGIGCFFHYQESKASWQPISAPRVRHILINFLVPYMHHSPLLYTGAPSFLDMIISQAKATALHEPFKPENGYIFGTLRKTIWLKEPKTANAKPEEVDCDNHPGYKIRNAIPIPFDRKNTGCTTFRAMLDNIMEEGDQDLLQYWCGMALLGRNFFHKILVVQGPGGSGKSTLANIIEQMIGLENVATLVTQRLAERFELSEFFGKTLLVGKDVQDDFLSCNAAPILKSLSGDSNLKAEVKNMQARVRLGGPFNVLVVSNPHLYIRLQDDAAAWLRRLWVIPVRPKVQIIGNTEKADYHKTLIEAEGPGILYWMLIGARKVLSDIKAGKQPRLEPVQQANAQAFILRPDELQTFVSDRLEEKAGSVLTTEELYEEYSSYVGLNGKDPVASTVFQKRIVKHLLAIPGVTKPSTIATKPGEKPVRGYRGVAIKPVKAT